MADRLLTMPMRSAGAWVVFLWLLANGAAPGPVSAGELVRVAVTPPLATLQVGQSVRFQARGYDAANQSVPFSPAWQADGGGSIDRTGLFRATQPGRYTVVATDPQGHFSATATVVVRAGKSNHAAQLSIEPALVLLRPGQEAQFTAYGFDRQGRRRRLEPRWWASGGTIDPHGRFRAGNHRGYFRVTATDPASGLQASAVVRIFAP